MIKKRNGFLIFCLSFLPGAGEMYMGFMKMGVSLMSCFFLALVLAQMGLFDFMVLIATVVWFYGFFHVHNLAGMSDEMFYETKDEYLFPLAGQENEKILITGKYRKVVAVILIAIGVGGLLKSLYYMVASYLPETIRSILNNTVFYYLPRLAISIGIIVLGVYMIYGKKKQLEEENEQGAENVRNTETLRSAENVRNIETLQNAENVRNIETFQNSDNVQNVENARNAENVLISENVQNQ